MPLVSVIVPTYNCSHTLAWALGSLLAQDHEEWECILVDDCSTDSTQEIVGALNDSRIRYFLFENNLGSGAARQFALERSRGDYTAFLDADDWIYPDRLSHQLKILQDNPSVKVLGSGAAIVNNDNELLGVRGILNDSPNLIVKSPIAWPPSENLPIIFGSCIVNTKSLKRVGFDPFLRRGDDKDMLQRLMAQFMWAVSPKIKYAYRQLESVTYSNIRQKMIMIRSRIRKNHASEPFRRLILIWESYCKQGFYSVAFRLHMGNQIVMRRNTAPNPEQINEFLKARKIVEISVAETFVNKLSNLIRMSSPSIPD